MRSPVLVVIPCCGWLAIVAFGACKPDEKRMAQEYVDRELAGLKQALAARDEVRASTGCALTTVVNDVSKPLRDEIEQLCYVEAPKLHIELAIASARKFEAEHPDSHDFACALPFASLALQTVAEHPSTDPALKARVDELAKLCPELVAKYLPH